MALQSTPHLGTALRLEAKSFLSLSSTLYPCLSFYHFLPDVRESVQPNGSDAQAVFVGANALGYIHGLYRPFHGGESLVL